MDPKQLKLQKHRAYMAGLVLCNLIVESVMLQLFAMAGTISPWVPLHFFVLNMAVGLGFYLFIRAGWNLRLKDKGPLVPQLAVHGVIQMGYLVLVPQLAILFMLVMLVAVAYAAVEFRPRQFAIGCIVYGVGTGTALLIAGERVRFPGLSGVEIVLIWLFFTLALACMGLASARFSRLRDKLSERNRQLRESLQQIEELASRDYLTGVLNRGKFMELLEAELQRSERTGDPFCLVLLDLDHFKKINDSYGHPVGDTVLKTACDVMMQTLRSVDSIGRLGGEEFAILMPATDMQQGMQALERLRTAINDYGWQALAAGLTVRFSAGIACAIAEDTSQSITQRTDEALYRAKRLGRDRTGVADMPQPQAAPAAFFAAGTN